MFYRFLIIYGIILFLFSAYCFSIAFLLFKPDTPKSIHHRDYDHRYDQSIVLVLTGSSFPKTFGHFYTLLQDVDFTEVLMRAMLNFLLFAAANPINLVDLRKQRAPVIIFSTVSLVISAFAEGALVFYIDFMLSFKRKDPESSLGVRSRGVRINS